MSRVGRKPILIPANVEVKIDGQKVQVFGPKGEISKKIRPEIKIGIKEKEIFVNSQAENKKIKAFWGLSRMIIANMIKGVTEGYEKKLEIEGLGFKALLEGKDLVLFVGFTNPVKIESPEGIKFSVDKNVITISGVDKELVGQIASKIRKTNPPEPYKGKGIRYLGEVIRRKEGKKVVTTG